MTQAASKRSAGAARFDNAGELTQGLLGAGLAVSAWAAGSVLAKAIDMGGMAIAVYRFTLFSLLMVLWLSSRGKRLSRHVLRHSMWGGIALGVDVAFFFSAVKLTTVVNATLIGAMQPIFVGVIAAQFFGEKIRRRDVAWSGVAIAGVVVVVLSSNGKPEWSLAGDLLAVGAMVSFGGYFIFSKQSKEHLTPTEFTAGTAVWTAGINVVLGIAFGQDLSWPSATNWGWLILMTVLAGIVGHTAMNWSLVRIPLWLGSTLTLMIPVVSSLIAWAVLGEALSLMQAAAAAVVLGALFMVVRDQGGAEPEPAESPID